jgi:hypothetical protein
MENLLRDRIRERLDALNLNPFEAARRIPAERAFLNDLLIGKKKTIRSNALHRVAEVLDCDTGYLMGAQDMPRRAAPPQASPERPDSAPLTVALAGVAEAGAWRSPPRSGPPQALPLAPDPRFPAASQGAFLIRGDHAAWLGAGDGSVILAVTGAGYRDGDVVLIRRTRKSEDGPEEEITLRRLEGGQLISEAPGQSARIAAGSPGVEIIARAVSAHRVF